MAKRTNSANFKGTLEVDFNSGIGQITEVTKDEEKVYNLFEVLEEFNGKTISLVIKEDKDIEPVE